MEQLIIAKHGTLGSTYRNMSFDPAIKLSEEKKKDSTSFSGIYFDELAVIVLFTLKNENFLYIENRLIKLTADIRIEYYCGEKNEESWLNIYEKNKSIFEMKYINRHEPYIDFVSDFEDWEIVNFACPLAKYINKVQNNPGIVLFPSKD